MSTALENLLASDAIVAENDYIGRTLKNHPGVNTLVYNLFEHPLSWIIPKQSTHIFETDTDKPVYQLPKCMTKEQEHAYYGDFSYEYELYAQSEHSMYMNEVPKKKRLRTHRQQAQCAKNDIFMKHFYLRTETDMEKWNQQQTARDLACLTFAFLPSNPLFYKDFTCPVCFESFFESKRMVPLALYTCNCRTESRFKYKSQTTTSDKLESYYYAGRVTCLRCACNIVLKQVKHPCEDWWDDHASYVESQTTLKNAMHQMNLPRYDNSRGSGVTPARYAEMTGPKLSIYSDKDRKAIDANATQIRELMNSLFVNVTDDNGQQTSIDDTAHDSTEKLNKLMRCLQAKETPEWLMNKAYECYLETSMTQTREYLHQLEYNYGTNEKMIDRFFRCTQSLEHRHSAFNKIQCTYCNNVQLVDIRNVGRENNKQISVSSNDMYKYRLHTLGVIDYNLVYIKLATLWKTCFPHMSNFVNNPNVYVLLEGTVGAHKSKYWDLMVSSTTTAHNYVRYVESSNISMNKMGYAFKLAEMMIMSPFSPIFNLGYPDTELTSLSNYRFSLLATATATPQIPISLHDIDNNNAATDKKRKYSDNASEQDENNLSVATTTAKCRTLPRFLTTSGAIDNDNKNNGNDKSGLLSKNKRLQLFQEMHKYRISQELAGPTNIDITHLLYVFAGYSIQRKSPTCLLNNMIDAYQQRQEEQQAIAMASSLPDTFDIERPMTLAVNERLALNATDKQRTCVMHSVMHILEQIVKYGNDNCIAIINIPATNVTLANVNDDIVRSNAMVLPGTVGKRLVRCHNTNLQASRSAEKAKFQVQEMSKFVESVCKFAYETMEVVNVQLLNPKSMHPKSTTHLHPFSTSSCYNAYIKYIKAYPASSTTNTSFVNMFGERQIDLTGSTRLFSLARPLPYLGLQGGQLGPSGASPHTVQQQPHIQNNENGVSFHLTSYSDENDNNNNNVNRASGYVRAMSEIILNFINTPPS